MFLFLFLGLYLLSFLWEGSVGGTISTFLTSSGGRCWDTTMESSLEKYVRTEKHGCFYSWHSPVISKFCTLSILAPYGEGPNCPAPVTILIPCPCIRRLWGFCNVCLLQMHMLGIEAHLICSNRQSPPDFLGDNSHVKMRYRTWTQLSASYKAQSVVLFTHSYFPLLVLAKERDKSRPVTPLCHGSLSSLAAMEANHWNRGSHQLRFVMSKYCLMQCPRWELCS